MFSLISLRFWFAHSTAVWRASCVVGSWVPLGAAAMFLYVRARGDREDSLAAAWMVRALGVQSILAWAVGMSDFFRGPPGRPPAWDADLGGPFVLMGFALPFALAVFTLARLLRLHRELRATSRTPVRPGEAELRVAPFRGTATRAGVAPLTRAPYGVIVVAAIGTLLAAQTAVTPYVALLLAALPLAALAARNHRALLTGVGALAWISGAICVRRVLRDEGGALGQVLAFPWLLTASSAVYLVVLEALRRGRFAAPAPGKTAAR
jgi:hypothetical protein